MNNWFRSIQRKLIICLVRRHVGLKKFEYFRFRGQKSPALYFFGTNMIFKETHGKLQKSSISLNWLLDNECDIIGLTEKHWLSKY